MFVMSLKEYNTRSSYNRLPRNAASLEVKTRNMCPASI
jgi:hypothetical protein